jgi:UDP-glucose 4-epimerase
MKILFTGASSFTGYWFVKELAQQGHTVLATFRKKPGDYPDAVRRQRAEMAASLTRPLVGLSFGDDAFIDLIKTEKPDLLCHHAADVSNYKSPDFDVPGAVANNTRNLRHVLEAMKSAGSPKVLLTGSFFESHEGAGSEHLPAFSPYGLSKAMTSEAFRHWCWRLGLTLGKFVIPNPFGPWEEPRFTGYLIKTWYAGQTAAVSTPAYVRDNIHVSLLARCYAKFVEEFAKRNCPAYFKTNTIGYAETQGAFAQRFASEMRPRLGLKCELELKQQTDWSEPRVRVNLDLPDHEALGWDEKAAWDELAEYYRKQYSQGKMK